MLKSHAVSARHAVSESFSDAELPEENNLKAKGEMNDIFQLRRLSQAMQGLSLWIGADCLKSCALYA